MKTTTRKVWVGTTNPDLAKGTRCAFPLDPSGLGAPQTRPLRWGSWRASETYRRFITRRRLAAAPPVRRAFKLPRHPHDDFIKTSGLSRPLEPTTSFVSAGARPRRMPPMDPAPWFRPWRRPKAHQALRTPTNPARIGCARTVGAVEMRFGRSLFSLAPLNVPAR